jgi:hypothetical protein
VREWKEGTYLIDVPVKPTTFLFGSRGDDGVCFVLLILPML